MYRMIMLLILSSPELTYLSLVTSLPAEGLQHYLNALC